MTAKIKPVSKKAHGSLTYYGWETKDGGLYTHPKMSTREMVIMGHTMRPRAAVAWQSRCDGEIERVSYGADGLEYYLMVIAKREKTMPEKI